MSASLTYFRRVLEFSPFHRFKRSYVIVNYVRNVRNVRNVRKRSDCARFHAIFPTVVLNAGIFHGLAETEKNR